MTVHRMAPRPAPATLPPDTRIYVVGDIHGCATRLAELHGGILADLAIRPVDDATLVHLGDYVDRGPDSAGVIVSLMANEPGLAMVNLLGNHERTMLEALDGDRAAATDWLQGGGRETLISYGIDPDSPRKTWAAAVPPDHVDFLRALTVNRIIGPYLFVHAGIRPGVSLADQTLDDMLTIRARFLTSDADFGYVVVHGHTPRPEPVIRHNRIGIDTRAALGGPLTCAVLERDEIGFLQT